MDIESILPPVLVNLVTEYTHTRHPCCDQILDACEERHERMYYYHTRLSSDIILVSWHHMHCLRIRYYRKNLNAHHVLRNDKEMLDKFKELEAKQGPECLQYTSISYGLFELSPAHSVRIQGGLSVRAQWMIASRPPGRPRIVIVNPPPSYIYP